MRRQDDFESLVEVDITDKSVADQMSVGQTQVGDRQLTESARLQVRYPKESYNLEVETLEHFKGAVSFRCENSDLLETDFRYRLHRQHQSLRNHQACKRISKVRIGLCRKQVADEVASALLCN